MSMQFKPVIFVVIPALLGIATIYIGSSVSDACAAPMSPNFGGPNSKCWNSPETLGALCCWTETDQEGIEITYCQGCDVNTDTGEFEDCTEVTQVRKAPATSTHVPPGVGGDIKDGGATDNNNTKVPKGLGDLKDFGILKDNSTTGSNNNTKVPKDLGRLNNDGGITINPGLQ